MALTWFHTGFDSQVRDDRFVLTLWLFRFDYDGYYATCRELTFCENDFGRLSRIVN